MRRSAAMARCRLSKDTILRGWPRERFYVFHGCPDASADCLGCIVCVVGRDEDIWKSLENVIRDDRLQIRFRDGRRASENFGLVSKDADVVERRGLGHPDTIVMRSPTRCRGICAGSIGRVLDPHSTTMSRRHCCAAAARRRHSVAGASTS